MRQIIHNKEYRFVIQGKAESFRTSAALKYKNKVAKLAREVFNQPLVDKQVEIRINYFHTRIRRMDMDNVAKCIIDALNGIAYEDDQQVSSQKSTSHHLEKYICLSDEPIDIIKPLMDFSEYTFVRIREVSIQRSPWS
ncbi:MAG: hypothetical protein A2167_04450 [Planctomycetes bacterium RBG_13_46_10]|nr:MAG: hypothetical protein A2167_04450 [Planctomycetes bacterium RBG_13_46_10]